MMHHYFAILLLITYVIQDNTSLVQSTTVPINTTAYALAHRCVWLPCNVTDYPSPFLDYLLNCCNLQVPLDYARPNQSISVSMSRLTPTRSTAQNNTLFVLMGGPGGSGWVLLKNTARLIPASFGITLIFPDHRGTGLSTVLGCDDNDSQIITMDCITYLTSRWGIDGLGQFSITAAAHDLSVQIQSYRADYPGRNAIYSMSYGTLWVDRFLQIYPTLVQSAVMDGVINPYLISISRYDLWASSVASQFLTYCQTDFECNRHFPAEQPPPIMLSRILTELDSGRQQCIQTHFSQYQLTSDRMRILLFYMMQAGEQYIYRTILPAVILRLNRCHPEDVTVLNFFFQTIARSLRRVNEPHNSPAFLFSNVLNCNIVQSELWLALNESEVDKETIIGWHKSTIMSAGNGEHLISVRSQWPKYPLDQYHDQVASYSPLLMISGQLDPATVFQQVSLLASITSTTRTFYGIPLAGHATLYMGFTGYNCPLHLICSWAFPTLFPVEWRDSACIRDMPTSIDFVGTSDLVQQNSLLLFNISRPFGNDSSDPFPSSGDRLSQPHRHLNLFCLVLWFVFDTIVM